MSSNETSEGTLPPDSLSNNTTQLTDSLPSADQTQHTNNSLEPNSIPRDDEADIDAEIKPNTHSPAADPMNMDGTNDSITQNTQSGLDAATANDSSPHPHHPAVIEPRIPQKKDASLREFLGKMDDYAPLIPDAVTDYYLTLAGLPPPPETDRRLARLLALATQKFIADVAADAYQYSRIRSTNTTSNNPLTGLGGAAGFGMNVATAGEGGEGGGKKGKDAGKAAPIGGPRAGYGGGGQGGGQGRAVLTMEDLGMAVGEYGVNVKRGEFYR